MRFEKENRPAFKTKDRKNMGLLQGPRRLKTAELPMAIQFANGIFRPQDGDMAQEYKILFRESNCDNLFGVLTRKTGEFYRRQQVQN